MFKRARKVIAIIVGFGLLCDFLIVLVLCLTKFTNTTSTVVTHYLPPVECQLKDLKERNNSADCEQFLVENEDIAPSSLKMTLSRAGVSNSSFPWVYAITPTYERSTQLSDLTCLCQTLMNVKSLIWILIEDSRYKTEGVSNLLQRCNVQSVHLRTQNESDWPKPAGRGIPQRIAGLNWLRKHCIHFGNCSGALYFLDDDNKYDLRLFENLRMTNLVSVWPVAFSGGMLVEGPICEDGMVVEWHASFSPARPFPIDMAGFAVNVGKFLEVPNAVLGYKANSTVDKAEGGWQESRFIENFLIDKDDPRLECRGSNMDILVWHTRSERPVVQRASRNSYGLNI